MELFSSGFRLGPPWAAPLGLVVLQIGNLLDGPGYLLSACLASVLVNQI